MINLANAAHALALLGNPLAGKFLMPHTKGDQALLNSARAFATDAADYTAQFVSVGLPANFITTLNADITAFEAAITAKGTGTSTQAGATGGLENAAHKAAVALHVLNTVVKNTYKNNPVKLANDLQSGKRDHFPTFAPPVLKPSAFAPLPTGRGWPLCALDEDGHPRF